MRLPLRGIMRVFAGRLAVCLLLVFGLLSVGFGGARAGLLHRASFELVNDDGVIWFQRMSWDRAAQPVGDQCPDMPKMVYRNDFLVDPFDENSWAISTDEGLGQVWWRGLWSVRPIHMWGVWSEIGCKELMGWGTTWQAGYYQNAYIWVTVGHVVKPNEVSPFGRQILTDFFILDDEGNHRELRLVGCKPVAKNRVPGIRGLVDEYSFCVFVSGAVSGAIPIVLDSDYIDPSVRLGERVYTYGCVPAAREIEPHAVYEVSFMCVVGEGIINGANTVPQVRGGGDFASTLLASGGMSGSPIIVFRDGAMRVVGVINGGVRGHFSMGYFLDADLLEKAKEWIRTGSSLYGDR